jgi:hypothetical protein
VLQYSIFFFALEMSYYESKEMHSYLLSIPVRRRWAKTPDILVGAGLDLIQSYTGD